VTFRAEDIDGGGFVTRGDQCGFDGDEFARSKAQNLIELPWCDPDDTAANCGLLSDEDVGPITRISGNRYDGVYQIMVTIPPDTRDNLASYIIFHFVTAARNYSSGESGLFTVHNP
jgi:hypothetical protein